jgi:glutathione S-transferase
MSRILLYDAVNSPAGRRVRMTLLEKGVGFDIRWINLALLEQKDPAYLAMNPNGVVPTLVHDGKVLFESNVINEYLDATFPVPSLIPAEPFAQAQMRMWMAFELEWAKPFRDAVYETYGKERLKQTGATAESLSALIAARTSNPAYLRMTLQLLTAPRNDALLADRVDVLIERMNWMDTQLADGREWLLGSSFTLADIAVAPRITLFPLIGIDDLHIRFRHIGAFMERIAARPSWNASDLHPVDDDLLRVAGRYESK